jgi:2-hydroxy-3-keto-5-methylthiopentenyl-1-phosphate phosphatase
MVREKILVSDFDGTMTRRDFFRLALEILPMETAFFWERYKNGEISHFQALASIFAQLRLPESRLDELMAGMELEKGIAKAVEKLNTRGWRLVIASAGCLWYIEKLLAPLGITPEVHANPGRFNKQQGLVMELPVSSPYYSPSTGIDKTLVVRAALNRGLVAFAGDGRPDLEAALLVHPSLRFAKGRLTEELAQKGKSFRPFQSWGEMVDKLLQSPIPTY